MSQFNFSSHGLYSKIAHLKNLACSSSNSYYQSAEAKNIGNQKLTNYSSKNLCLLIGKQQKPRDTKHKKKYLRLDSSNKLQKKIKSTSAFAHISEYQNKTPLRQCITKNTIHDDLMLMDFRLHRGKNLQQLKGNNLQVLSWSKAHRKKSRRLTGLSDCQKARVSSPYNANENEYQLCKKLRLQDNLHKQIIINTCINEDPKVNFRVNAYYQGDCKDYGIKKLFKKQDFYFVKKIGSGNFGTAYLAVCSKTGFICAIKKMSKQRIKQEVYENQIIRQTKIQFYLKHQNIVQLYGMFEDENNIYLILEYCADGHLYQMIRKNTRLNQQICAQLMRGVAEGVQHIHRENVIHRDLKPQNIFISFGVSKIGDFGWSVYTGQDKLRKTISGSPLYLSPQIVQKQNYDQKIDIWGLGIITYQSLVGMTPFKIYSIMNLNRIVDDQLNFPSYIQLSQVAMDFIQKSLHKNPNLRLQISQLLNHQFLKNF